MLGPDHLGHHHLAPAISAPGIDRPLGIRTDREVRAGTGGDASPRSPSARTSSPLRDPALEESPERGKANLLELRRALRALGAPAVGDPGPRLQPGPDRLARADPRRREGPAHVRPLGLLHRRAAGHRRARADHARLPDRGAADLPLDPDRRRGSPRPVLQPLLRGGRRARRHDDLADRLRAVEANLTDSFTELFDEMLKGRVDRLAAEPEDTEALVEAITLYHMIIEGALALTGQHFIIEYNTRSGTLPGFVEGFENVARDEHRHIAFGVRFLTDMAPPTSATATRSSARWPRRCRSPTRCSTPLARGGGLRDLRRQPRRDARLRRPGPDAAPQGHRPRLRHTASRSADPSSPDRMTEIHSGIWPFG